MFVRNQWYVAGWDREVGRKPLARTICGEPVVLYRKLDGGVVALHDACPHRLLPLSMGLVEGDNLRCRYHGVLFDQGGRCLEMPGEQQRLDALRVKQAYPVIERYRFVWVWIGEAEKADPSLLPNLWPCENEGWAFEGDVYHIKADYRLMIDNLMDLTHETHVHPTSIGQAELLETPLEVSVKDGKVYVTRWMKDVDAPPFWRGNLGKPGNVDRWQICEFMAPHTVMIDVGVAPVGTGAPEGDRSQGVNGYVIDVMSPESETTCWYYWGMARNFSVNDVGFGQRLKEAQGKVFMEDVEVLEAQQRSILANPDQRLRAFDIDGGGTRSRGVIERMLREQASADAAAAAAE
jgi:phenylpropionate dioxygenase-like ring-hydroxylating dioxygenase large terminal subunit